MTDNEITREKTFSEELPYFKERMKEISDNYDNPDGYADVTYLSALSDSNRIVRKAEEEITRQQEEIENLTYTLFGVMHSVDKWLDGTELEQDEVDRAVTMREKTLRIVEEKQAEIERLKEFIVETRRCDKEIKSEAVKECLAKVKNYIKTHCNPYGKPDFEYDTSIKILNFIDTFVKAMVDDKE